MATEKAVCIERLRDAESIKAIGERYKGKYDFAKGINVFDSYCYYVVGPNIGDVDYTAKLVVGVKNGETYYDHSLAEIEKSALIDGIDEISSSFTNNKSTPVPDIKDKRFILIRQTEWRADYFEPAGEIDKSNGAESDDTRYRIAERLNMQIKKWLNGFLNSGTIPLRLENCSTTLQI